MVCPRDGHAQRDAGDELVHAFRRVPHRNELPLKKKRIILRARVKEERPSLHIAQLDPRGLGSFLWLVKTVLLKILAANFNVVNFFDRIQDSVFHQYVLQTLSGLPLIEEAERVGREPGTGHLSFASVVKKGEVKEKKVIDMGKVHKMKREKVSAWTMRVLMKAVRTSGLSTISDTLDQQTAYGDGKGQGDRGEITSEMEALAAAYHVFRNVDQPCFNFIEEEDLLRFMIKEEVDLVFPLFDGAAESGKITRKAFTEWVVKVYTSRKALAHS
ncbi:hypothetical protein Bca4012_016377 [Brassica carinata]